MSSDISTHNVEQLAERNSTVYGALEEDEEEVSAAVAMPADAPCSDYPGIKTSKSQSFPP
jgi:hypothetical protein